MRHTEPTPEQIEGYKKWVAERPERVRKVAERLDPWTLYRLKTSNQRVCLLGFDEEQDGRVTVRITVSGEFNLVTFERDVFGIDPDDLEECDLPGPNEQVGSLDLPIEEIRRLHVEFPEGGVPAEHWADLARRYPLKQKTS